MSKVWTSIGTAGRQSFNEMEQKGKLGNVKWDEETGYDIMDGKLATMNSWALRNVLNFFLDSSVSWDDSLETDMEYGRR